MAKIEKLPYRCWVHQCDFRSKTEDELLEHYKSDHPEVEINMLSNGSFEATINDVRCVTNAPGLKTKAKATKKKTPAKKTAVKAKTKPKEKATPVNTGKPTQTNFQYLTTRIRVKHNAETGLWFIVENAFSRFNEAGRKEYFMPGDILGTFQKEHEAEDDFIKLIAERAARLAV